MKYLIIIHSPLQVLNAYEFIKSNNVDDDFYDIIFVSTNNNQHDEMIRIYIKQYLKKDFYLENFKINNFTSLKNFTLKMKNISNKFQSYNYLLFGNINSLIIRYFVNYIKIKKILIDDGTSTLNYNLYRKYYYKIYDKTKIHSFIKYIFVYLFFRLDFRIPKVDYIFTYFYKIKKNKILRNELIHLRNKFDFNNIQNSQSIFFLGQPIYYNNPFSLNNYIKVLYYLKNNLFQNEDFIYVSHRNENKKNNKVIKFLKENNIKHLKLNEMFELYLQSNKIIPKALISACSTAMITCQKILQNYDFKIYIVKIEKDNKFNFDFQFKAFKNIENGLIDHLDNKIILNFSNGNFISKE